MNNNFQNLKNKIRNKDSKILIIGLGYVGLKLFLQFRKKNFLLMDLIMKLKK